MFLVSHSLDARANQIRRWRGGNASVSVVVAAAYFEWTISRAIIGLSRRSNREVREGLAHVFGLEKYKDFWWVEVQHLTDSRRLPEVVKDWKAVTEAFDARNRLVHGRDRYTANMATPKVDALLAAISDIHEYCLAHGVDLGRRLRLRRRTRAAV